MAITNNIALLSNAVATGNPYKVIAGGLYALSVVATWNGSTAKLQILGPDGATYQDIDAALSFTANGIQGVDLPGGCTVKMVVSGGPPAAMYANLGLVR